MNICYKTNILHLLVARISLYFIQGKFFTVGVLRNKLELILCLAEKDLVVHNCVL